MHTQTHQARTKTYHHGDLHNSLILKGLEMLNDRGLSAISLREIARNIGVGHNAPYRHFKNKQQLLEAIASMGFRRLKAYNLRLELEYANDPETQLFESAMHLINMANDEPNLFNLMFGGNVSLFDCGDELKKESQASMQSFIKILSQGQKQDVFNQDNLICQTLATMSLIYGFAMMTSSGMLQEIPKTPDQMRGFTLQVFDILLTGLKKT
ncbi:MAG: TetR/AcrR family transcriptional regulator [Gammaproteobacteria bacterium]|nr:TetR/AcrR family transcriptional regulator [Gammaproteobacteria bacterium]MCW8909780.1 TetR/AcrR family transcriptional regulator [Gammaproteobacteria bacterium]MCW9004633.1 TetR/AcrR family transcriptional regulator [Gammaproteobacteria bacterium]MCW9055665.1 TetR/AcrR family transcriptional regulator [Gammaproteobacteria bacterium]